VQSFPKARGRHGSRRAEPSFRSGERMERSCTTTRLTTR
jgi:hypothetical protein